MVGAFTSGTSGTSTSGIEGVSTAGTSGVRGASASGAAGASTSGVSTAIADTDKNKTNAVAIITFLNILPPPYLLENKHS